jgi:hypothetical protein
MLSSAFGPAIERAQRSVFSSGSAVTVAMLKNMDTVKCPCVSGFVLMTPKESQQLEQNDVMSLFGFVRTCWLVAAPLCRRKHHGFSHL